MKLQELREAAAHAVERGWKAVVLLTPEGWEPPAGFPRRELMCVNAMKQRVVRVKTRALVGWLERAE